MTETMDGISRWEQEEIERLKAENRRRTGIPEPEPEPSGQPGIRSKKDLPLPADRSRYISEHGGAAYLKLPPE
ncbi:MAG TPA: hypothetical protein PLY86_21230 [bacterium]|nr:hypothetical protein [bacterium]